MGGGHRDRAGGCWCCTVPDRGYRGTSVDDIVETADVARGTFYKYFSDKRDLLAAAAAEIYGAGMAFADRIAEADPVADEHHAAALAGHVRLSLRPGTRVASMPGRGHYDYSPLARHLVSTARC